ncbi:helix-turn-helix domain-containing protein, partial [Klebsiella pneumoniae]|uniref:helix-turn-helix domain-containing protein n=1 Tax=Klebsiella pneumoniae TaxID=573 RepID=UPI0023AF40AC
VIPLTDGSHIAPQEILSTVAQYYGVTVDDLRGSSRAQQYAIARHVAMYLCRDLTDLSLPKIASIFGNRDHSTVLYANKKITS